MSRYTIEFIPSAQRQFKKLPSSVQAQVQRVIDGLAENPRPHGYKKLHGKLKAFHRIDTGNFRVVYAHKGLRANRLCRQSRRPARCLQVTNAARVTVVK